VQGVDALCLQYLLDDPKVSEDAVADAYREQFAFGASQRVKVRGECVAYCSSGSGCTPVPCLCLLSHLCMGWVGALERSISDGSEW
jgi:hypothetical protein